MCKKCFEKEYPKFNSYDEFEDFNNLFNSKIAKTIKFVREEKNNSIFHNIYKCDYCNELWCFSDPDNHWRGYFLTEKNVNKEFQKENIISFGSLILIGFVLFILLKLIFNN